MSTWIDYKLHIRGDEAAATMVEAAILQTLNFEDGDDDLHIARSFSSEGVLLIVLDFYIKMGYVEDAIKQILLAASKSDGVSSHFHGVTDDGGQWWTESVVFEGGEEILMLQDNNTYIMDMVTAIDVKQAFDGDKNAVGRLLDKFIQHETGEDLELYELVSIAAILRDAGGLPRPADYAVWREHEQLFREIVEEYDEDDDDNDAAAHLLEFVPLFDWMKEVWETGTLRLRAAGAGAETSRPPI